LRNLDTGEAVFRDGGRTSRRVVVLGEPRRRSLLTTAASSTSPRRWISQLLTAESIRGTTIGAHALKRGSDSAEALQTRSIPPFPDARPRGDLGNPRIANFMTTSCYGNMRFAL